MILTTPAKHLHIVMLNEDHSPLCEALKSAIEAEEKKEAPPAFPAFVLPINAAEEALLLKFLSVFPQYLFLFDETIKQLLLPKLVDHYKTIVFNSVISEAGQIPDDFNQVTEILSSEERRQLIDVFLPRLLSQESMPVTSSGDPYCTDEYPRYDKKLGGALVALQDDLSAEEIVKLSDYYIEYFDYEYGLGAITEHFKYLVPKLRPQQINKMLTALLPVVTAALHSLHNTYWFEILNQLKSCVDEDGTQPLPLANEFLAVCIKLDMDHRDYNSLLSSVRKTLTSESREKIVEIYLNHNRFDLLAIMYDTLTLANRVSVANKYLEWIVSDFSENAKSNHRYVVAIHHFKDYFGNSLEEYINKIMAEADTLQIIKIPLLTRVLSEKLKQRLTDLSINLYDNSIAVRNVKPHNVNDENLNKTILYVQSSLNSVSVHINKSSIHNTFDRSLNNSIDSLIDALKYCDIEARDKIFPLLFTAMGYNSTYKISFMCRSQLILDRQSPEEQTKIRAQLVALIKQGKSFQHREEIFSQILHKYLIHPNCNASLQEVANLPYRPGIYNKIRFLNTFHQIAAKTILLAKTTLASENCDIVLSYRYS